MDKRILRYILLCISSLMLIMPQAKADLNGFKFKVESDTLPLIMGGQAFFNLAGAVL